MQTYNYTAYRKSDGVELFSDTISDVADQGMGVMANAVKAALIRSHPDAVGLTNDDIDISMSFAK